MRPHWKFDSQAESIGASQSSFQLSFLAEAAWGARVAGRGRGQVPALGMAVYFIVHDPQDEAHQATQAELTVYTSCKNAPNRGQPAVSSAGLCWPGGSCPAEH